MELRARGGELVLVLGTSAAAPAPGSSAHTSAATENRNRSRCTIDGPLLFRAPIPPDFIVSPDTWDGLTPNSGLAVLMPDGRTIKQTQPFARCTPDYGTSRFLFGNEDLYGPVYYGAHGGSGLSCIGGTIRVGRQLVQVPLVRDIPADWRSNSQMFTTVDPAANKPGRSRTRKILLTVLLLLVAVPVVFLLIEHYRGKRILAVTLRELQGRGEVLDIARIAPPPVPPASNALDRLIRSWETATLSI